MQDNLVQFHQLLLSRSTCFHNSAYGSWVMGNVLYGEILDKNLLNATFFNAATGMEVKADYFIILHYLCMRHFEIVGVLLLMTVMSICLGIFLSFHLHITSRNMTTNEYFKWRAVKKFHGKEAKRYQRALKYGKVMPTECHKDQNRVLSDQSLDADVGCTGPVGEASSKEADHDEIFNPGLMPENIYE
jgi:hypothetical protein